MGSAPRSTAPSATPTAPPLLARARMLLDDAARAETAADRFCLAHLAALRTAAVVVADRARPASSRRRLISVWVQLQNLAPEYDSWTTFFAAGASIRSAAEAGATSVITSKMADDELRAAREFLALVEDSLGLLAA